MDPFSAIFSTQLIFFALAIFALTFIIRTVLEYFISLLKTSNVWNNLILPVMPLMLGALGGLSKTYPNPLGISIFARETFGLVAGLVSGLGYQMLKGFISSYLSGKGVSISNTSTTTIIAPPTSISTSNNILTTDSKEASGMSADVHPQ